MVTIARGQQTLEATYVPQASRLLFADTDALATSLWSRWLHGECLPELEQLTAQSHHDLYLLTQPDLPWVADEVRYFPNGGAAFYEDSLQLLERMHRPYRVIGGQGSQRLESAIKWVDEAKIGFFQKHRNL